MSASAPVPHASNATCRMTAALLTGGALQVWGPHLGQSHVWPVPAAARGVLGYDRVAQAARTADVHLNSAPACTFI